MMALGSEVTLILFIVIEIAIFAALRYFSAASSQHREEVAKLRYEIGRLRMLLVSMNEQHAADMDIVLEQIEEDNAERTDDWGGNDPPF